MKFLTRGECLHWVQQRQPGFAVDNRYPTRAAQGCREALGNLGSALARLGHWTDAVEYHKRAAGLQRSELHLSNLGAAYTALKRFPDAERSSAAALAVEPTSTDAKLGLARVIVEQGGRDDEALLILREVARALPEGQEVLLTLSGLFLAVGALRDGGDAAARAVARDPQSGAARAALVFSLLKADRIEDARNQCQQAIACDPESLHCLAAQAATLSASGEHADAESLFETIEARDPDYVAEWDDLNEIRARSREALRQS